jgi:DNA polymerase V
VENFIAYTNNFGNILAKYFSCMLYQPTNTTALVQWLIPYYNIKVPAGFPSPALDYMEVRIDLNTALMPHPLATFMVDCEGDSMIQAFVPPTAKLLIDRSLTPKDGDMVMAKLNGEYTIKFLKKNDVECWLCPANPNYPDIRITPEMQMEVCGVVSRIIIDPKDVKYVRPGGRQ